MRSLTHRFGTLAAIFVPVALPTTIMPALRGEAQQRAKTCMAADIHLSVAKREAPAATRTGNILVANQSGTASLIDLVTGHVTNFEIGADPHNAAISPDGRWGVLVTFGPMTHSADTHVMHGNKVVVIDLARKEIVRTIDTRAYRGLHDVTFRPGYPSRALITAQTSRRVLEVDVATGNIVGSIETRGNRSHMLAVTPDGTTVFTTNEDPGTISRLDLTTHSFVAHFPATPQVEGIAVAADGKELWVGETRDGSVTVRDATTGNVLKRFTGFRAPNILHSTRDGRRVVISDLECTSVVVADAMTRQITRVIKMPPTLPIVGDFSPDGRIAFVSLGHEDVVIALDLATGEELARHKVGDRPDGLSWAPKP